MLKLCNSVMCSHFINGKMEKWKNGKMEKWKNKKINKSINQ
jgi:hypothetical protein